MLLRRLSIATALMLSLGSSVALLPQNSVIAQPYPSGDMMPGQGGMMMQKLNLTADQKTKIQAIQTKYKPQMEQKRQAVLQAMKDMHKLMSDPSATDDQLRTQHKKVQDLHQEIGTLAFESMLEVRKVLTPEQVKQLGQMRPNQKGKPGGYPGGGRRMNK